MTRPDNDKYARISAGLVLLCSLVFVLAAFIYNEFLLGFLDPSPPLSSDTVRLIRWVQLSYLAFAALLYVIYLLLARWALLRKLSGRKASAGALLSILVVCVPFTILESALRQNPSFAMRKTRLFIADSELGWRLRPNVTDNWLGTRIRINGKGLRGPELEYAKPRGTVRLLYLGDSVTFGFGVGEVDSIFPYLVENSLEHGTGLKVETLDTGVGGYSPWQEYLYLEKEGIRYQPDIVIVSFVLNDVTEMFALTRYGGTQAGYQLSKTVFTWTDYLSNKSAVFHFLRRFVPGRPFSAEIARQEAIRLEIYSVQNLVNKPDLPEIRKAWEITLKDLNDIIELCRSRNIQPVLVAFPFTFQFAKPDSLAIPQRKLAEFAGEKGVPYLDLLPELKRAAAGENIQPGQYFIDRDHLSKAGHRAVAEIRPASSASARCFLPGPGEAALHRRHGF